MTQTQAPPQSDTVKLIAPFMNAVRDVLQTMAHVQTRVDKPFLKTDASTSYQVCGIIGFSGQLTGSVMVSFSDAAAEKLVEAFAGAKLARNDPDFADAIGELTNMIAGSAKQHLGGLASISIPTVVIGNGYVVANMHTIPCLVIPCSTTFGSFAVEVCIMRNPGN
jgi:chemotaxis protein CheX